MALCLSACQATIHVGIDVNQNGGGTVIATAHLDRDAANFAPDVRTADLVAAGWKVVGPTPSGIGGVDFTASKPFADPAEARAVVTELSGSTGPFRDLAVASHRSFFETTTSFQGMVDLTCGLNCFSDPQLQQALGGAANLGIDPSKLQADSGVVVDRLFQFEVAAHLPGKRQSSNATAGAGRGTVWKVQLGQKVALAATARAWNIPHIVLVAVIGILLLAAIGLVVVKRRTRRPAQRR